MSTILAQVYQIGSALLILAILIFVHELGHFLVAKWCGVGVVEFAIGFGRKLFKKRIGETTYSIGLIPLGGYVRMIGDDPSQLIKHETIPLSSTEAKAQPDGSVEKSEYEKFLEELTPEDRAFHSDRTRWFLSQGYFSKAAIVIAGPLFNILFAILLAVVSVYSYGKPVPVDAPVVGDLRKGFPAEKAGLKLIDKIVSIDGVKVKNFEELIKIVTASAGKELVLSVERPLHEQGDETPLPALEANLAAGKVETLEIHLKGTDEVSEIDTLTASASSAPKSTTPRVRIGVGVHVVRVPATITEALKYGTLSVWEVSRMTVLGLRGMIVGEISTKNIGGPIMILGQAKASAKRGLDSVLDFMILLSVSLAILNLLPIPVLDGGHLVFFTIEAFSGSPVRIKIQQIANQVGVFILLMLMLFAFSNDILRYFGWM